MQKIEIVDYLPEYGHEIVALWRESFEQAVGVVDPHPIEEHLKYLEEKVISENQVLVVLEKGTSKVIGFMAMTPEMISQLYVHVNHQIWPSYNRAVG